MVGSVVKGSMSPQIFTDFLDPVVVRKVACCFRVKYLTGEEFHFLGEVFNTSVVTFWRKKIGLIRKIRPIVNLRNFGQFMMEGWLGAFCHKRVHA